MLKVKDIMSKDTIVVTPEMDITDAAKVLLENHINGVPVVGSDDQILGILCQSDLIIQQKKLPIPSFFSFLDGIIPLKSTTQIEQEIGKISATTVGQAMTHPAVTVSTDTSIEEVAELMVKKNYHTLPVVNMTVLVGIIGKEDVLRTLIKQKNE